MPIQPQGFSEQLSTVARKLNEGRALIRPISQVNVRLKPIDGKDRFVETVKALLPWMSNRAGRKLPDEAWQRRSFELADVGAQRVAAVALDEPRYWAGRVDDADKNLAQRTWVTEVGVGVADDGDVLFGCRLVCATRGEDTPFVRSVPGFVAAICTAGPAELDGRAVTRAPWLVASEHDVAALVDLLELPGRRAPVVVLALDDGVIDPALTAIDARLVHKATLGAAHVVVLTGPASFHLTDAVGKESSVFRRAVRTYRPGFTRWRDSPLRHPLALPERIEAWPEGGPTAFSAALLDVVLAATIQGVDREEALPSYTTVRQYAAQQERARARSTGGSDAELLKMYDDDNVKLRAELDQQKQEFGGLLAEAERERDDEQNAAQEAMAQAWGLRRRIGALESQLEEAGATPALPPIPTGLDTFEDWCGEHLVGSVTVLSRAFQGAKKSVFHDPTMLYRALLLLRDHYVPMKRFGGKERMAAFEQACQDADIENSAVGEATKRYKDEYAVRFGGRPRTLDWHLKHGDQRERAKCFRLYYFWDDETECVVVGDMPAHLKSDLT